MNPRGTPSLVRARSRFVLAGGVALLLSGGAFGGPPECPEAGQVLSHLKISDLEGGFSGILDNSDRFGIGAAAVGDIDNDGVEDMAVGADLDDDGGMDRGAVWVLLMNANGTVKGHRKVSTGNSGYLGLLDDGDQFGYAVSRVGDVDSNGIPDFAVGALLDDDGGLNRGAVWIIFPRLDGTVRTHEKISNSSGEFFGILDDSDSFGRSVTALGDFDNDGVPDIAVGAANDDDGGADRGAVWLLYLTPGGGVKEHRKISGTTGGFTGVLDDNDRFGISVASVGDLDGNGVVDLAVGADLDDDGSFDRGAVWILFLNSAGSVISHQKISDTMGGLSAVLDNSDQFGTSVANVGDLDGDGRAELAVGAFGDDDGGSGRGALYVLFLNSNGTVKAETKISNTAGGFTGMLDNTDFFGASISRLPDFDGDGVPNIASSAYRDDDGGTDRGAVYLLSVDGCQLPVILAQPVKAVLLPPGGGMASFSVTVGSTTAVSYQWRKDGQNLIDAGALSGSSGPTLMVSAIGTADIGAYDCVVTNIGGSVTSQSGILAVRPCPGDADGGGTVDFADITAVLTSFGLPCAK